MDIHKLNEFNFHFDSKYVYLIRRRTHIDLHHSKFQLIPLTFVTCKTYKLGMLIILQRGPYH
jgi:hypothetical protein